MPEQNLNKTIGLAFEVLPLQGGFVIGNRVAYSGVSCAGRGADDLLLLFPAFSFQVSVSFSHLVSCFS